MAPEIGPKSFGTFEKQTAGVVHIRRARRSVAKLSNIQLRTVSKSATSCFVRTSKQAN